MLTLLKTMDMEEKNIYFEEKPFDNNIVSGLDMETIDAVLDEGNRYLQSQLSATEAVERNCTMLLGWLVGAFIALSGFFAIEATSAHPEMALLASAGYEALFCLCIVFYIIRSGMYRHRLFLPGDSPSHMLMDEIMKPLEGFDDKNKYIKGWHLYEIQFKIMMNKKEQSHRVMVFRYALALILSALITGMMLMFSLLLLLP